MLISSNADQPGKSKYDIPSEVRIWLDKGWTLTPTERRGFVISGQKTMRRVDKLGLGCGVLMLAGFAFGIILLGFLGLALIALCWLDYKFNTKPPTKFFPEPGEQKRVLERP